MHQEVTNLMFDFNSIKNIISLSSMLTKMLNKSFYLFWKNANFSGYYSFHMLFSYTYCICHSDIDLTYLIAFAVPKRAYVVFHMKG